MERRPLIVLVVEDEVLVRMAMAEALRRLGFVALEASGADEALDILHAGVVPSALLTDIRMPGAFDGLRLSAFFEVLFPDAPVFVTSALIEQDDWRLSWHFLAKPMAPEHIARTIADALDSGTR